jgi:hypothetical protein
MPQLDRSLLPRNSRVTEHICLHCEVTFYSTKPKTKYCSSKCRVYAHLDRKALKAQEDAAKAQIHDPVKTEVKETRTTVTPAPKVVPTVEKRPVPEVVEKTEVKKEPAKPAVVASQMSLF